MRATSVLLVLNVALWRLAGIGFLDQMKIAVLTVLVAYTGSRLLLRLSDDWPDRVVFFLCGLFFGAGLLSTLTFLGLHRGVQAILGNPGAWVVLLGALFVYVVCVFLLCRFVKASRARFQHRAVNLNLCLLAAMVMASLTYYFCLTPAALREPVPLEKFLQPGKTPALGRHRDKLVHIQSLPESMIEEGLPSARPVAGHRALQSLLLSYAPLFRPSRMAEVPALAATMLSLIMYFSICYSTQRLCSLLFGLGERAVKGSVVLSLLLAPIPFPLLFPHVSSYLGGINSSGALYHNTTQLFSLGSALPGIVLILLSLRSSVTASFVVGSILLTLSLFTKPGVYMAFAPSTCLLFLLASRGERLFYLKGVAVIVAGAAAWFAYPHVMGTVRLPFTLKFAPLAHLYHYNVGRYPAWAHVGIAGALVPFVHGLAAFLLPAAAAVAEGVRSLKSGVGAMRQGRHFLFFAVALLFTFSLSLLFITGLGQRIFFQGNLNWARAAAMTVSVPLLLWMVDRVEQKWLRAVTWALVLLHLWGGVHHLYYFSFHGKI